METLRELFITLGLRTNAADWAQAMAAVEGLKGGAELLVDVLKEVGKTLVETVTGTAEYADRLGDAAIRTGATAESLQELGYAAKLSGSSFETLETALTKLGRTMGDAVGGSAEAQKAFRDLGIPFDDLRTKTPNEIFLDVAESLKNMEDPAQRNSAGFALLGKQFKELLPTMSEGREGLMRMAKEARELGLVIDNETVKSAARFNDQLDILKLVGRSLMVDVGIPLIQALAPVVEVFKAWIKQHREVIKSGLTEFANGLVWVFTKLYRIGKFLADNWKLLAAVATGFAVVIGGPIVWSFIAAQVSALAFSITAAGGLAAVATEAALTAAALGFIALEAVWAALPFIGLIALVALLALALEDLYMFFTEGDSVIGRLGDAWAKFIDKWTADSGKENGFTRTLKDIIWFLTDIEGRIIEPLGRMQKAWMSFWTETIPGAILGFVKALPAYLSPVASIFASAIPGFSLLSKVAGWDGGASSPGAGPAGNSSSLSNANFSSQVNIYTQPNHSTNDIAGATVSRQEDLVSRMLTQSTAETG
jgi:hypothetical protein